MSTTNQWQPIETAPKDGRLIHVTDEEADKRLVTSTYVSFYKAGTWAFSKPNKVVPLFWAPMPAKAEKQVKLIGFVEAINSANEGSVIARKSWTVEKAFIFKQFKVSAECVSALPGIRIMAWSILSNGNKGIEIDDHFRLATFSPIDDRWRVINVNFNDQDRAASDWYIYEG